MQTPKVWGECGTYRLTQSAWAHSRPEGPQSQERNRHMWSLGGGAAPQMPDFYSFFLSLGLFVFHFIRCQYFLFVCLHVVVVVIILLFFKKKKKKTNHIWSCFSADTGTRGGDEADTNMRQAGRAPEGGWAPNTNSVR